MKKTLLTLLALMLCSYVAFAQKKEWSIGARLGEPTGIAVKKYLKGGSNALEIAVGVNGWGYYDDRPYWKNDYRYRRSTTLLVNYLWHKGIRGAKGFDLYYGLGGQLSGRRYYDGREREERSAVAVGITGTIGVEWFIPDTPVSVSADIAPYMELAPATAWIWFNGSLGLKFNF